MLRRKALAILIASAFVLTIVGLVTAQRTYKLREKHLVSQRQLEQQKRDKELEDATPIEKGVMTKKQKAHSKLFEIPGGKQLEDFPPTDTGDVSTQQEVPLRVAPRYSGIKDYLQGLACKSDAVIVGTVRGKESQLTEQGTNIFTDYELAVDSVLKDNATATIRPHNVITVTRAGGTVKLNGNGRLLRAEFNSERPLKVDKTYLLFLKFIPDTGSYSAVAYTGDNSFEMGDGTVKQVSNDVLPLGVNNTTDQTAFMNEVKAAVSTDCGQ